MNKDTKQQITLVLKRSLFLFSVAFFIFSCDNDELEYDCENLQANIGEACDSAGIISSNCVCVTTFTEDTTVNSTYDCSGLMLNIGDTCDSAGVVNSNCQCISGQDSTVITTYDCPGLMLNIGDSCDSTGVVNSNCDCIADQDSTLITTYDCLQLMQNFGDSCVYFNSDSIAVYGIIDTNCFCN